jgi:hypothetical protein
MADPTHQAVSFLHAGRSRVSQHVTKRPSCTVLLLSSGHRGHEAHFETAFNGRRESPSADNSIAGPHHSNRTPCLGVRAACCDAAPARPEGINARLAAAQRPQARLSSPPHLQLFPHARPPLSPRCRPRRRVGPDVLQRRRHVCHFAGPCCVANRCAVAYTLPATLGACGRVCNGKITCVPNGRSQQCSGADAAVPHCAMGDRRCFAGSTGQVSLGDPVNISGRPTASGER